VLHVARNKRPPIPKAVQELEPKIRALLDGGLNDKQLRDELEALAVEQAFNGFTYLWGPSLYRRNRVMFRPFILNHFARVFQVEWNWTPVRWQDHATILDAWLDDVDQRNDVALFRQLYPWKHSQNEWGGVNQAQWQADLLARFGAAREKHERHQILTKFDFAWSPLDESAAVGLYEIDAAIARPFILRHPPNWNRWGENRELPAKLCAAAQRKGDDELYFALYRKMAPQKVWEKDVAKLAADVADPHRLLLELERRHPEQTWGFDVTPAFFALAKVRGRQVVPYLMKHLDAIWSLYSYGQKKKNELLEYARQQGWWDVWSVLVRKGDHDQYNQEVLGLVTKRDQPDEAIFRRLILLSGASSEWNWGRFAFQQIQALKDEVATPMYRRFPELLHGPYRQHLNLLGWQANQLDNLTAAVLARDDHELIDHLAGQAVLIGRYHYGQKNDKAIGQLAAYYKKLSARPVEFARRVASVLGRVPAYSLSQGYNNILESNELARLMYAESEAALSGDAQSVRDLLEAPEIRAQVLALRVLARPDERSRTLAEASVDLLQATLLRSMHRHSRIVAFAALANAANSAPLARTILLRARQALDLPEAGYPREHLIALIADLLRRWPELRAAEEQPCIFASHGRRSRWASVAGRKS
jgi:hypothetical protein